MKKILLALAILTVNFCLAQNAKNEGWYIQELHYPEINLPVDYKNFSIEIEENNENIKLNDNGKQKLTSFNNPKLESLIKSYFELPGYTKSDNPDFIIKFNNLGLKHIVSATEKKAYGKDAKNTYTGIIEIKSEVEVTVKDLNDSIIFTKKYSRKTKSESIGVYKNSGIPNKTLATTLIKNQYQNNARDYRTSKNVSEAGYIIQDISKSLKALFSSYYESKRVNLFRIKKEEKYGIDNNTQVDKLVALNKVDYSDSYNQELHKLVNESIEKFNTEIAKIKNKEDKKEKKIYWALLSNLSGAYYAIGDYEKAIEYAKKRMEVDYNKKWKFNLEIAESRKKITDKNKS